ncbi:OLC1v1002936C2 [Oldenlandia corymbosa var. corymbosa]|nr:OLC1v1002936C2 [Oldenlandia corymbosa var. corymbosa]
MVADHQFTRLDTLELKDLICRNIGQQRAKKYLNQLKSFFDLQISKIEFNKICARTIGRENIALHNQLINFIMMNACLANIPPPKVGKVDGSLMIKVCNQGSCLQSLQGDALIQSPRKCRSPRVRKSRDCSSPVGPLGKSPSFITGKEGALRIQEQQSATELRSLGSRPPVEVASVEEGEEVEQLAGSPGIQSRSPVTAPYGISIKIGGGRKALRIGNAFTDHNFPRTCHSTGILPDSRSLRSLLEKKLEQEGVGISLDCANLLNNGLDEYLKRLIEPCMGLAGTYYPKVHTRNPCNLVIPGSKGMLLPAYSQRRPAETYASMLDFRVAMELNPSILGEDWPLQLEKIRTDSCL